MSSLLTERVAVVTGGASGIGRATALAFARHGADVVVADLRPGPDGVDPTHEVVERESDRRARFVDCDVTDLDDVERALDTAEALGGVDVFVSNAGVFERADDFFAATPEDYAAVMRVNAMAPYFCAQRAAVRMAGEGGSIINVSSLNGIVGNGKSVAYSASKGAVRLLTYALAHRLGREAIRVNAIHPGAIETPMTEPVDRDVTDRFVEHVPSGRVGRPSDVAGVAVFLASDLAAYVTGESVVVDGGYASTGGLTQPFEAYPEPAERDWRR